MPPIISRGFRGRRDDAPSDRVPPGQYVTRDFPVLSAGPTPHTPLEQWDFSIVGEVDEPRRWTWEEFRALPSEEVTVDIHCVTKWSKLDTVWQGVSIDTLLDGVETVGRVRRPVQRRRLHDQPAARGRHRRQGLGRVRLRRRAARARARRPGAHARAPPLLLEERQVGARAAAARRPTSPASGRSTATTTTAIHGGSSGTGATDLAGRGGRRRRRRDACASRRSPSTCPAGPDIAPGSTSTSASPPRTATRRSAATRSHRRPTAPASS